MNDNVQSFTTRLDETIFAIKKQSDEDFFIFYLCF